MLIKMFSTDRKIRYDSFDEVITEIDSIMSMQINTEATETATTRIEEKKGLEQVSVGPMKPSVLRLLQSLFLLMLLIFVAIFYLTYTGDIYYYIDMFADSWDKFIK
ncbi:MAG: hypothetical protein JRJ15_16715 [Deltaproteobacteria bacterium]|nr:hypothetical protein [Deltaproteobacteria bacterium]